MNEKKKLFHLFEHILKKRNISFLPHVSINTCRTHIKQASRILINYKTSAE